jgi:hypothetical protein
MKCLFFFLYSFFVLANDLPEKQELDILRFDTIKDVLRKDALEEKLEQKKNKIIKISQEKEKLQQEKYFYPKDSDFWSFFSEFWLVKNATILKWDFTKPQYGIEHAFEGLLENLGFFERKFKILLLNTPVITHMGLPTNKGEYLFLLSVPFIRTLDLSKIEIALLLLEDMLRVDDRLFIQNLKVQEDIMNKSFYGKEVDLKKIELLLKSYSEVSMEKGFNFQQQFEITKKMDVLLKSDPKLWNSYMQMLQKIDRLVKLNLLYKEYTKIYPSPEMQIKWLSPPKKHF